MRAVWLLVWVLLGTACGWTESGPQLLSVQNVSTRHAERGEKIEFLGSGFPEGRSATVTFRGDLLRPGRAPSKDVRIVARAFGSSHERVSVFFDEALQREFCGAGENAEHTTFRGDVVVAFAPRVAGSPPVTGVLHGVVLDLEAPPPTPTVQRERERLAERARHFLGLRLEAEPETGGFRVAELRPAGRAERAGLVVGDVIEALDGVRVMTPTDFVPARGPRFSVATVRRGRLPHPLERSIDVTGFHTLAPAELTSSAVAVFVVLLLLFLLGSRWARVGSALIRLLTQRLQATARRTDSSFAERLRQGLRARRVQAPEPALSKVAPHLTFLIVSAASTIVALGHGLVAPDLDLGLACVAVITPLLATAVVIGTAPRRGSWSVRSGLLRSVSALLHQLPVLAGIATVVVARGSVRLTDLVAEQGAWPWEWHVFHSPFLLVTFVLYVTALVPELSTRDPLELTREPRASLRGLSKLVGWVHLLVMSSLAAALFLGGWRLPGMGAEEQFRNLTSALAGAVVYQAKCWSVVALVLAGRWLFPGLGIERTTAWCWRWALPASATCFGAMLLWLFGTRHPFVADLERNTGAVVFAAFLIGVALTTARVRAQLRAATGTFPVSPWL